MADRLYSDEERKVRKGLCSRATRQKYIDAGLCSICGKPQALNNRMCKTCIAKQALYYRNRMATPGYREKMCALRNKKGKEKRYLIFKNYGNKCTCCGETERFFLELDHVNNDGNVQRKKFKLYDSFLTWIIKNNYPKSIQLLCCNCNRGKARNKGICPHQRDFSLIVKGIA